MVLYMPIVLKLLFLITFTYADPIDRHSKDPSDPPRPKLDCPTILRRGGASSGFGNMVAHHIHSMSVQDLRMFDPTITEDNVIPTINVDLRAEPAILPYAPSRKTNDTDSFLTEGMKALDLVLTHMDETNYEINGYSTLERVVRAFHMREVWARVKVEFEELGKSKLAPDPEFCKCASDVRTNGIMRSLRNLALRYREPGLIFGDPAYSDRTILIQRESSFSRSNVHLIRNPNAPDPVHDQRDPETENNPPVQFSMLRNVAESLPPLENAAVWEEWKINVRLDQKQHRDTALYLFCVLKKPAAVAPADVPVVEVRTDSGRAKASGDAESGRSKANGDTGSETRSKASGDASENTRAKSSGSKTSGETIEANVTPAIDVGQASERRRRH